MRRTAVVLAIAAASPAAARAADSWAISIGVRETGSSGAIGSNGGTTGGIEWINLDGYTINADNTWQTVTWNFAPGLHTATNFSGGNGVLSADNNKGVLEHIRIRNTGGNSGGEIRLRIDDVINTVNGVPTLITGFVEFTTNTNDFPSGSVMFRDPIFSGSTINNMSTGANGTLISTASANSGSKSLAARWTFVPNGNTSQWLRLTTANTATLGNPVIDLGPTSSLSIAFRMSVYNPTGDRVRGIDASQFQGSGHDWVKAAAPMSAGGGGMTFAFLRATRGGTSGTSTTGSMRVDDPQYIPNITGAKAAGILTGPYHFARWDQWASNADGTGDAAGTVGRPEDEARHMLEIAGKHMKVGYMRPVFDLEDPAAGTEPHTNQQLTNYVLRFADTIKKYKGTAAGIIVYAGTTYANKVNSPVAQFPLWMPRYNPETDWSQSDPFATESSYGAWNGPGVDNPLPWKFWQYYSPDVYIPGINAGTHNDINVAHGDINFVRQYLIQGAIWQPAGSSAWTNAANWCTGAAPTASTEVLIDTTLSGTITLASGQAASGIYFAQTYTLSGGSLTLTDGRIDVDASRTGTIATSLSAPSGFRKVGVGTMTHSSGTSTVTGIAQVLQGTMNVSGGSIAVSGNLMVNPELTQFDKSLISPFPSIAAQITSSTVTINGGNVTAAAAYVGGTDTASGAIGTLNVSSGSLTVTGPLKIWNSAVPMVDSKVNLSGGTLSVGSLDTDGDAGSFNWTGGTFAVTGAGGISVASGGPIGASLTVGNGKTLNVTNAFTIGSTALVTLQGTGAISVGTISNGSSSARFNWTGGTFTHNGPGSSDLGTRTLGSSTAQTLNVNAGTVTATSLTIGALGNLNVNAGGTLSAPVTNNGAMSLNGGTVSGSVNNSGVMTITGAATFGAAATVDNPGTINVNSGANVAFNAGLAGAGSLNIAAGGSATAPAIGMQTMSVHGNLTINSTTPTVNVAGNLNVTGTMDLKDNHLLVISTPLGSWNGSSYTGVSGMVAAGKVTSTSATPLLTALAVATAGDAGRTTFGPWPVNPSDVLVMFTYAGDANLSGFIDADDYFQIDANYGTATSATMSFHNGDFNLDGVINGDDYAAIDSGYSSQGPPISAAAAHAGVMHVPEPTAAGLLMLGLMSLRRRRGGLCKSRRRRECSLKLARPH